MTLSERLSHYACSLRYDDLSGDTVHEAKRRVIDALGCAMGAFPSEPGRIARELALTAGCARGGTVLGTLHRTSPDWAAFANGVLIRYLDFNDTYLSKEPAHPSDNIAAALAVGEARRCDGRSFLTAVVLGYEVQCRLCDAASIRARGWDHVTYGSFSTSLVSAKLMGLDEPVAEHAVSLAAIPNNALRQTRAGELSHWKGCAFGNASRNGVFAALLAERGMTGPPQVFEGVFGFHRLVSGPFELGPLAGEAERPFMINRTSIKFFPAEYHAQSAIQAALELRKEISRIDEIASIDIYTFDAAADIIGQEPEKWRPKSRETADHSLPYCTAAALMDGRMGADQFSEARIKDERLIDLVQKVKVHRSPEMNAGYPEGIPNRVEVTVRSGERFVRRVDHPRGHHRNPMTDLEVEQKFEALAGPLLAPQRIRAALDGLWKLEELPDVGRIPPMFEITRPN